MKQEKIKMILVFQNIIRNFANNSFYYEIRTIVNGK